MYRFTLETNVAHYRVTRHRSIISDSHSKILCRMIQDKIFKSCSFVKLSVIGRCSSLYETNFKSEDFGTNLASVLIALFCGV